jgi:hypothetical protein
MSFPALRYVEGPDSMAWFAATRSFRTALYGGRIKRLAPGAVRVTATTENAHCIAMGATTAEALQNALEGMKP